MGIYIQCVSGSELKEREKQATRLIHYCANSSLKSLLTAQEIIEEMIKYKTSEVEKSFERKKHVNEVIPVNLSVLPEQLQRMSRINTEDLTPYISKSDGELKFWNGVGRRPSYISLDNHSDTEKKAELTAHPKSPELTFNLGGNRYMEALCLLGALIVSNNQQISFFMQITGRSAKQSIKDIELLSSTFSIDVKLFGTEKKSSRSSVISLSSLGPLLLSDGLPYIKMAFPTGVVSSSYGLFKVF